MKKLFPSKLFVLGILSLVAFVAFAKQDKVVQIFRNGEVIQEYAVSEIDYIEVNDLNFTGIGTINGHDYVDMGLPSGLKWATCNVGASVPTEYGGYFAWGETNPKLTYTVDNSLMHDKEDVGDISGDSTYDAARANWGGSWRMPSISEMMELVHDCQWIWTVKGEISGYEVIGPNGQSIFFPAAGYYIEGSLLETAGSYGACWSSMPWDGTIFAYCLFFNSGGTFDVGWDYRYRGLSVRPVSN
ncbi:MAG: hypothetical protein K2M97_03940 [Muribaculaceae bacterium]|nr:hypothetical protein [Muribaculaceae bacterium]